jgi:hypothetical protein
MKARIAQNVAQPHLTRRAFAITRPSQLRHFRQLISQQVQ